MNELRSIRISTLVLLRLVVPYFCAEGLFRILRFIESSPNSGEYELSISKFNELLPLSIQSFDESNIILFKYLIIACAVLSTIGLLGRLNLMIIAMLGFYFGGKLQGMGIYPHELALVCQMALLLALLPGTLSLSIDEWMLKRLSDGTRILQASASQVKYGTRIALFLFATIYFTAGVSKIRFGGTEWLNGSTFNYYLTHSSLDLEKGDKQLFIAADRGSLDEEEWRTEYPFVAHTYGNVRDSVKKIKLAAWVANNKVLIISIALFTVLVELAGFMVFIGPMARNLYLFSIIGMHIGIEILMGIDFSAYQFMALCLIDWRSLFQLLGGKVGNLRFFRYARVKLSVLFPHLAVPSSNGLGAAM